MYVVRHPLVLQDHSRDSPIPLSSINKPSKVIGINPSNTLGLRPHPRVWFRFDNTPHLLGEAFDDHGSEVETSHSLWMWSVRSRPGIGETDRPCRQVTHLLQTIHHGTRICSDRTAGRTSGAQPGLHLTHTFQSSHVIRRSKSSVQVFQRRATSATSGDSFVFNDRSIPA